MIVLRTIETFLPYICGPVNQAYQISSGLEKRGVSSPLITSYSDVSDSLPRQEWIQGVHVTRVPSQFQAMRYCVGLGMLRHLKGFDVIHSHNYRNFQTDAAFFFAKLKRKPFVLNSHGSLLGYKHYLQSGLQKLPYRLYDSVSLKMAVKRADCVVVSSRFEYQDAIDFGVQRKKIKIIPAGIAPEFLKPVDRRGRSGVLKILMVGRLARVRRIELLLKAVKNLTFPYEVILVGGEERTSSSEKSGYLDELKGLARDWNVENHVRWEGPQKRADLMKYYSEADVFVYPSRYENFGQPLLEAAASGLPIIATPIGVARDLVEEGETGFLVPADPEIISERLTQLRDSRLRESMGEAIRKKVGDNFSWDRIVSQYIELYKSL